MQNASENTPRHGLKDKINVLGDGPARRSNAPEKFLFGRMIRETAGGPLLLREPTCATLGERMTAQPEAARKDTDVPAGYTYFGQFLDHDITLDLTEELSEEQDDPNTPTVEQTPDGLLEQGRSPSLDLDSLYGALAGADPRLVSGAQFHIGCLPLT